MSRTLLIQQYELGPLNNFLYLLGDTATKEMAIVDPAWEPNFLCDEAERLGYIRGEVTIGEYTFVGARSIIMPNVTIGKGCLIAAGTLVNKSVPDFSIVVGNPGIIKGNTKDLDKKYFNEKIIQQNYFDRETIAQYLQNAPKS